MVSAAASTDAITAFVAESASTVVLSGTMLRQPSAQVQGGISSYEPAIGVVAA